MLTENQIKVKANTGVDRNERSGSPYPVLRIRPCGTIFSSVESLTCRFKCM